MKQSGERLSGSKVVDGGTSDVSSGWSQLSNSLVDYPYSPPGSEEIDVPCRRSVDGSETAPFYAAGVDDIVESGFDAFESQLPAGEEESDRGPFFPTGFDDKWKPNSSCESPMPAPETESESGPFFPTGFDDIWKPSEASESGLPAAETESDNGPYFPTGFDDIWEPNSEACISQLPDN